MRNAWHLLTGEYPPSSGGVSDYTRALACELARRGLDVHVWCPSVASDEDDAFIRRHALPDSFGARTRRTLEEAWRAVHLDSRGRATLGSRRVPSSKFPILRLLLA